MASFMMSNPWMDMTVMSWPVVRTDVRKSPRSGPRIPGGSKMVKNGDFGKNPQIWPKMAKLAKMAKTGIFGKTPKMTQKTTFFRECENAFTGALTCDESRRIIYCLDTRYGPQNGGFGPPGGWDGLHEIREIAKTRISHISVKTGFFGVSGKPSIQTGSADGVDGVQDRSKI